jgi:hypothetical protein
MGRAPTIGDRIEIEREGGRDGNGQDDAEA